ncbi:helix-turn-helix domain-containing protein [Dethiobacter alkaliphilus]|uniref:Uncharacterized protein n=1 Tax=Dethiobacter alkaliphilus AHT 1 TaxID=555088 RepID=C0GJ69_DETAL|nr:hypothetical protein [Dethiobacter alkaliphilus]EEG76554.1 conserved hypothetical protein [Dethiobacter alkaliphilus AHT 1]MCW3489055.1 hypothetical protein [Dethiobacter alkaliphilus]
MECVKCNDPIPKGEECNYLGKVVCEDCYIMSVSPPKTCDVSAVHAAKKHREAMGHTGTEGLTDLQKDIVNFIKEQGQVTKPQIAEKFALKQSDLERQFAVLRHCEVLKAKKDGDKIYIVPFDA